MSPGSSLKEQYRTIMGNKDNKIVLAPGVSFVSWENDLQAKLARLL